MHGSESVGLKWDLHRWVSMARFHSSMVGSLLVDKPLGLGDVNLLGELGMEKRHVNVDLVDLEVVCVCEGK